MLLSGSAPIPALMLLAGVLGAGQAFFNPAMTGLIPELVSTDNLRQANALRGVAVSSGQIIGPSLAGVIVAAGGAGWAIAIDAGTYLVSFMCLLRLELPARIAAPPERLLSQFARGWREFRSRTWLWVIVGQFAAFNALSAAPFMVLGAVTARTHYHGAGAWGAILAALGLGSILGGALVARIDVRRPLVVATIGASAFAVPEAFIAIPTAPSIVVLGAVAAGLGLAVFTALWETTLQRCVPREVLSRVSAYDWFGSAAFVPIGYLLAGPLAATLGIQQALLLGSIWTLLSCAGALMVPSIRALEAPSSR
jgi:MFS family permease